MGRAQGSVKWGCAREEVKSKMRLQWCQWQLCWVVSQVCGKRVFSVAFVLEKGIRGLALLLHAKEEVVFFGFFAQQIPE